MDDLRKAVEAVLREALDAVEVHPCDVNDDAVRAKGLHGAMAVLYATTIAPPVAAGSVDTCAEMRALCSACGGTGDVHSIDGEWRGQCTCVHAWRQRAEKAEARTKELEARLVRRSTSLPPETQQAIAAARAAGQTIAATPVGLVFMNYGAEPGDGELDCPACGGSGHAGDVAAGSAP